MAAEEETEKAMSSSISNSSSNRNNNYSSGNLKDQQAQQQESQQSLFVTFTPHRYCLYTFQSRFSGNTGSESSDFLLFGGILSAKILDYTATGTTGTTGTTGGSTAVGDEYGTDTGDSAGTSTSTGDKVVVTEGTVRYCITLSHCTFADADVSGAPTTPDRVQGKANGNSGNSELLGCVSGTDNNPNPGSQSQSQSGGGGGQESLSLSHRYSRRNSRRHSLVEGVVGVWGQKQARNSLVEGGVGVWGSMNINTMDLTAGLYLEDTVIFINCTHRYVRA